MSCFTGKICPVKILKGNWLEKQAERKLSLFLASYRFYTGVQNLCLMTWKGKVVLRDIIALAVLVCGPYEHGQAMVVWVLINSIHRSSSWTSSSLTLEVSLSTSVPWLARSSAAILSRSRWWLLTTRSVTWRSVLWLLNGQDRNECLLFTFVCYASFSSGLDDDVSLATKQYSDCQNSIGLQCL